MIITAEWMTSIPTGTTLDSTSVRFATSGRQTSLEISADTIMFLMTIVVSTYAATHPVIAWVALYLRASQHAVWTFTNLILFSNDPTILGAGNESKLIDTTIRCPSGTSCRAACQKSAPTGERGSPCDVCLNLLSLNSSSLIIIQMFYFFE